MWQRWNSSTHIFEKSDNDGGSWVALPLNASVLNEGNLDSARLPNPITVNLFVEKTRPELQIRSTGTSKGRYISTSDNVFYLTANISFDGSNWNLDDTTKNGTIIALTPGNSNTVVYIVTAGSNPATSRIIVLGVFTYSAGLGCLLDLHGVTNDFPQLRLVENAAVKAIVAWDSSNDSILINTSTSLLSGLWVNSSDVVNVSKGIKFPATQVAQSDVNTLDDYEEGTFTPTWTNLTVGNASVNSGRYLKVGRFVFGEINLIWGSTTSISGGVVSVDVPINMNFIGAAPYGVMECIDTAVAAYFGYIRLADANTLTLLAYAGVAGGAQSGVTATTPFTWGSGDTIDISFFYEATS